MNDETVKSSFCICNLKKNTILQSFKGRRCIQHTVHVHMAQSSAAGRNDNTGYNGSASDLGSITPDQYYVQFTLALRTGQKKNLKKTRQQLKEILNYCQTF